MKVVTFRVQSRAEDPESLVDATRERPAPAPGELLVAVRAVSVNPVDTKARRGLVQLRSGVDVLG